MPPPCRAEVKKRRHSPISDVYTALHVYTTTEGDSRNRRDLYEALLRLLEVVSKREQNRVLKVVRRLTVYEMPGAEKELCDMLKVLATGDTLPWNERERFKVQAQLSAGVWTDEEQLEGEGRHAKKLRRNGTWPQESPPSIFASSSFSGKQGPEVISTPDLPAAAELSLTFHEDYAPPSLIVLQAADDLCFNFDLARLARHCNFFADLDSVPSSTASSWFGPVVSIPVSSDALKIVLDTIEFKDGAVQHQPRFPSPSKDTLKDIVRFIDMFDCPGVVPAFYGSKWSRCPGNQFALVSVAQDFDAVSKLAHKMVPLVREYEKGTAWWVCTLRDRAPAIHRRLGDMYLVWKSTQQALRTALSMRARPNDDVLPKTSCHRHYYHCKELDGYRLPETVVNSVVDKVMATALSLLDMFDDPSADLSTMQAYAAAEGAKAVCCRSCTERLTTDLEHVFKMYSLAAVWDSAHICASCL